MQTTITATIAVVLVALALSLQVMTANMEQPVSAATTPTTADLTAPTHPYADGVQPNEAPGMTDGVRVYEDGSYVTDGGEHGCLKYAPCEIK